jgi:hypothetical protein
MLLMVDGRIWHKAKNLPYKSAIVVYGAAMAGITSQISYVGCKKNCRGFHLTTLIDT